jgi:23S rRNA (adenine2030-N6)-methyltransferase
MNYRHAFHAGNFADVFKHVLLIALIDSLKAKPTPFCYIDTHAGAGRYDLRGDPARKTGESAHGVERVLAAKNPPAALARYLELLRALNDGKSIANYPGSPLIAAQLMREQDRLVLCDLQPDEFRELKSLFGRDERVGVHPRDGYAALPALVPPKEKRGLVLIDPPFEAQDDEYRAVEQAVKSAYARWPTGIYAIWYPIKLRNPVQRFHRWFANNGIAKTLSCELLLHPDNSPLRLNGCGLIVVNAPWKFDEQAYGILSVLRRLMADSPGASDEVRWLTKE